MCATHRSFLGQLLLALELRRVLLLASLQRAFPACSCRLAPRTHCAIRGRLLSGARMRGRLSSTVHAYEAAVRCRSVKGKGMYIDLHSDLICACRSKVSEGPPATDACSEIMPVPARQTTDLEASGRS